MKCRLFVALAALTISHVPAVNAAVIDFEGVSDSTPAATLYASQGIAFSSGIVVVSGAFGGSLNEVDFPPRAPGQAAFLNDADTTTITFSQPILSFSAFFTYGGPLTINFYGPGNALFTTLASAFVTNIGTAGDLGSTPNEEISALILPGVERVDILAPATDFTLDDLTFTTGSVVVPEPETGFLIPAAGVVLLLARRFCSRVNS